MTMSAKSLFGLCRGISYLVKFSKKLSRFPNLYNILQSVWSWYTECGTDNKSSSASIALNQTFSFMQPAHGRVVMWSRVRVNVSANGQTENHPTHVLQTLGGRMFHFQCQCHFSTAWRLYDKQWIPNVIKTERLISVSGMLLR